MLAVQYASVVELHDVVPVRLRRTAAGAMHQVNPAIKAATVRWRSDMKTFPTPRWRWQAGGGYTRRVRECERNPAHGLRKRRDVQHSAAFDRSCREIRTRRPRARIGASAWLPTLRQKGAGHRADYEDAVELTGQMRGATPTRHLCAMLRDHAKSISRPLRHGVLAWALEHLGCRGRSARGESVIGRRRHFRWCDSPVRNWGCALR